ncbi:MAG: SPOR domain-containing protein [Myxococcales bacterium]|nr:SPOR domain-containing protein [Myxococcota bacterium]MDW8280903.1 SPOR domain-containing protein [Myxococcales bacterium]
MRDLDRWKDKVELQLDGRQIFFLFFGSAVCACLIFVFGVAVGRRVEAQRLAHAPAAAEDPLAVLDELGNAEEGLTFHSALLKEREVQGRRTSARPPKAEPPKAESAQPDEGGERVATLAKKKEEPKKAEELPRVAEAKGADRTESREEKKPAVAKAPDKPKAPDKGQAHFTLQLSAFATKAEAGEFMRKLREAGYKPYLVESMVPGKGLMYRVRLGDYPSRDSALSAKSDFERKQKMVAYVARL